MCDTFVRPLDQGWLFGKNSDREVNEAQVLEYQPARDHQPGATTVCSYLEIPEATHTFAVILSRPFWMWGAEMGVNEHGLVIGNEAVWSKEPVNRGNALTGMDLLRLALERCRNAEEGVDLIAEMLGAYGQGGICGFQDRHMSYHNSYLLADGDSAWVMETAGEYWAAQKLEAPYAISNGLTIVTDFDKSHPRLKTHAVTKGWAKDEHALNFAQSYGEWFYTYFSGCRARQFRNQELSETGVSDVFQAFSQLRDHGDHEPDPLKGFRGTSICAHGANNLARKATQSVGSLVVRTIPGQSPEIWATGSSAPCTGVFKPLAFAPLPTMIGAPQGEYDPASLWWRHEILHREVLRNFNARLSSYKKQRDELERGFQASWIGSDDAARPGLMEDLFQQAGEAEQEWIQRVRAIPAVGSSRFWRKMNRQANIPVG